MYTIYEMCCDGFDQKLERQFLKPNRHLKKVYVCSPYSDPDPEVQLDNMRRARLYMLYANEHMGYLARAPHAYLPMLVCDGIPTERAMALRFGLELLERSDLLLVCGTTLSKGMKGEITHAAKLGIPIQVFLCGGAEAGYPDRCIEEAGGTESGTQCSRFGEGTCGAHAGRWLI